MRDESKRNLRVGLLAITGLALVAVTILMVGSRKQLFIRHTRFHTSFQNVTGLETVIRNPDDAARWAEIIDKYANI